MSTAGSKIQIISFNQWHFIDAAGRKYTSCSLATRNLWFLEQGGGIVSYEQWKATDTSNTQPGVVFTRCNLTWPFKMKWLWIKDFSEQTAMFSFLFFLFCSMLLNRLRRHDSNDPARWTSCTLSTHLCSPLLSYATWLLAAKSRLKEEAKVEMHIELRSGREY